MLGNESGSSVKRASTLNHQDISPDPQNYRFKDLCCFLFIFVFLLRWVIWYVPLVLAVGRWRQKDQEFKDIVGYMRPYFKKPS